MDKHIKKFIDALAQLDTFALIIVTALVAVDGYLWFLITAGGGARTTHEYILDVGQGDSELVIFPGNVKVMTDAGPAASSPAKVVDSLQGVLPQGDRYIDLAVISHPDSDHFAGYLDILDRYEVGAFLYNGRDGPSEAWRTLVDKLEAKNIPLITVVAGDVIHYQKNFVSILSPNRTFAQSVETNDGSVVEMVNADPGTANVFRTLLTGDAPFAVENALLAANAASASGKSGAGSQSAAGGAGSVGLHADVLKVAHHGSKYASSEAFLRAVNPSVAAIGAGAKNVYGHPSPDVLLRIASSTHAQVFRTDENGTVEIFMEKGKLNVAVEKR